MKTKSFWILTLLLIFANCKKQEEIQDFEFGDEIDLSVLADSLTTKIEVTPPIARGLTDVIPQTRDELEGMRTVVKIFDGKRNAGISIPGFGGLTLDKRQSNMNVYFIETKIVENSDGEPTVYGIGYSVHYLFSKVKRGIDINNLASVAASAELQSNKTSVSYSLQSFGITGKELAVFFKPEVNSNFDVDGFGVIQSKIDGIHNVITDSLLASRTKFTPEKLYFISPDDLRN